MTRIKEVRVLPYDPSWPQKFEIEASYIKEALKDQCIAVHHIGSTSVPGLAAKEDIDIMLIVRAPIVIPGQAEGLNPGSISSSIVDPRFKPSACPGMTIREVLQDIGYVFKGAFNIPLSDFFSKNTDFSKVNLRVVEEGHGFIELQLKFRDYLRAHPDSMKAYGELKLNLVKDPTSFMKQEGRFVNYTLRKNEFIKNILKEARYDSLIVMFPMHDLEWEAFHRIRKEMLFDPSGIVYDPNHPSMRDPNFYPMVLYKGVEIIGVACVQFLESEHEAVLRSFAIVPKLQEQGLGKWFLAFIEKWVKSKGKRILKMHSSIKAQGFYRSLGYSEMEFQDETPFKDVIDLGKML